MSVYFSFVGLIQADSETALNDLIGFMEYMGVSVIDVDNDKFTIEFSYAAYADTGFLNRFENRICRDTVKGRVIGLEDDQSFFHQFYQGKLICPVQYTYFKGDELSFVHRLDPAIIDCIIEEIKAGRL